MAFLPLPFSAYFAPLKLYLSILESSPHKLRALPTWLARFPRSRIASLFSLNFDLYTWKAGLARFFATEILVTRVTVSHRKTLARVTGMKHFWQNSFAFATYRPKWQNFCPVCVSTAKICELIFLIKLQEYTKLRRTRTIQVYVSPFWFCL